MTQLVTAKYSEAQTNTRELLSADEFDQQNAMTLQDPQVSQD